MKNRIEEKFLTNEGYEAVIIEWFNSMNCTIKLNDKYKTVLRKIQYNSLIKGQIKNPYHPSVYGIGFIGIGKHKSKLQGKQTKVYSVWKSMLQRSYSESYLKKNISYKDITVYKKWHNFQIFGDWFEKNYNFEYMEGWHLDKDILCSNCKIYSPETCCFVPREINLLFTKTYINANNADKNIFFDNIDNKYIVILNKKDKLIFLGKSNSKQEAIKIYNNSRLEYNRNIIEKWKNLLPDKIYKIMTI